MERLPPELWQMIFNSCGANLQTAFTLRLVCARWRASVKRLRVSVSLARVRQPVLEALANSFPNLCFLDIRHWKGDMRFSAFEQFATCFSSLTELHIIKPGKKDLLYLPRITSLQHLKLADRHNALTAEHVAGLSALHRLYTLRLVDVAFDALSLAAAVAPLPLRVLSLRANPLQRVRLLPTETPADETDVAVRALLSLLAPLSSSLQKLEVEKQPVPAELSALTGLTKLKLLSSLADSVVLRALATSLTHLRSLNVQDAWPAGEDGVCLTSLGQLRSLHLDSGRFVASSLLPQLTVFSELRKLHLACHVHVNSSSLPPLPSLHTLSLRWSADAALTDLSFLSLFTNLRLLKLGEGGNSHAAAELPLRSLVNLRRIELSWLPGLTLTGLRDLSCLTCLESLQIGPVMRLGSELLGLCASLPRLRSLCVRISWQSVAGLSALTQLTELELITLPAADHSEEELFSLSRLHRLRLGAMGPFAQPPDWNLLKSRLPLLKTIV